MRYSEAVDYLDGKVVLGVKPSLDRIRELCALMGNPQDEYDAVQITGTNGKTSVANMIAVILKECGYRVGLYTSPHLETVRERITVNGKLIPVHAFTRALTELKPLVAEAEEKAGEPLTYFEVVTAVAFKYFMEEKVDVAVLEVGMGGCWDATNVVDSDVAVITNVGLDHTAELGKTRKKIASEKVGIINEGSMVITAESDRDILMLISERCRDAGAELKVFGRDFRIDYLLPYRVTGEPPSEFMAVRGLEGKEFKDIKLPMLGKHQAINAACAIAAAQGYTDPRRKTDPKNFRKALGSVEVPGRLEIMARHPMVVTDGAHNVSGVDRLVAAITSEFDYDRLVFVVAILEDKDARGIIRVLSKTADEIIVTENRSSRSIPARKLGSFCRMERVENRVAPDFSKAVKLAYNIAGWNGLICITGSIYTVSEARIYFRYQRESREMKQDR